MDEKQKKECFEQKIVASARSLSDFFQVELTVKVFGKVIYHLLWPPKKSTE